MTVHEQKDRLSTLDNTIEGLTRELNEKKQVLQRETASFENQSKVLQKSNEIDHFYSIFLLRFSSNMKTNNMN
jgi:hypothetical protein